MWPLCQNGELRRVKSWQIHTAPRWTLKFTLTYIHFYMTFEYRYILQSLRVGGFVVLSIISMVPISTNYDEMWFADDDCAKPILDIITTYNLITLPIHIHEK